jgi:hypothetical protein
LNFKYLYRHGVRDGINRDIECQLFQGKMTLACKDKDSDEPLVTTFEKKLDRSPSSRSRKVIPRSGAFLGLYRTSFL